LIAISRPPSWHGWTPRRRALLSFAVTGDQGDRRALQIKLGTVERIAGFDCQWLILEPRDAMRYLQQLCAE